MPYNLALITGASDRLGRAMALDLARQGVNIALHYYSNQAKALEVCEKIRSLGVKAEIFQADLTCANEGAGLIDRITARLGKLDVLINNASIFEYDTLGSARVENWHAHMGSNALAPFLLIQGFAEQAPKPGYDGEVFARACVINMIDQRVRNLTPEFMTYSLAKHTLWAMTQTTAQALAPAIRVNAIGPGPTLIAARQSQDHFKAQRHNTLLKRGANISDIIDTMNYFLGASAVTGQLICVDGGQHLTWETADIIGQNEK